MEKIKFLVIAPFKGLEEIISDVLTDFPVVSADYYIADLSAAINVLGQVNLLEYDAILSRGGTAKMLSAMVNIPVYDVGISAVDALRSIRLAQNFHQKMAIVGFESINQTMRTICDLLHWDIPIVTIQDESEAIPALQELKDDGVSVVVCDVFVSSCAPTLGLNPVLVTSGYETISNVMEQAVSLTRCYQKNRRLQSRMTLAFQKNPYACTIFDSNNRIIASSLAGNDPLHILSSLQAHVEDSRENEEHQFEVPFKGGSLTVYWEEEFLDGESVLYVYTRYHEQFATRKINAVEQKTSVQGEDLDFTYYNSSHYQTSTQAQIEKYGRTLSPVVLSGELGTGKDRAAYYLYCISPYASSLFYQIDCEIATEKNWNFLLTNHDSPLMHNKHTLYFRHVDALSPNIFHQLLGIIKDSNLAQRNRLIFSFTSKQTSPSGDTYLADLMRTVSCLKLYLPSLLERAEDIPYLCTYYINRLNAELGRQIIGFDAKALRAMKAFLWEGNLDQFQRVVKELMLITSSSYISYEDTMHLLSQEGALWTRSNSNGFHFNLDQTLDDITYDIIREVLREENDNHTRTADRLGISRSTLWRILKNHEA